MSANWSKVTLGDLATIKHGWPFKSEFFSEELTGQPIVVGIGNFEYTGGFRFASTTLKEYRDSYPPEYELTHGDILLIMTCQTAGGEILGIPGKIPTDGRLYLHNQRLGKVVLRDGAPTSLDFMYWVFLLKQFNRHLFDSASGTKILHTAPSRIESFRFLLPPPDEQAQIARVLSAIDDKIDLNRRMNQTLEAMAQAIFRSWFVTFDPVRTKAKGQSSSPLDFELTKLFPSSFQKTAQGVLPLGWERIPLDNAVRFLNGLALQRFPPTNGKFLPVIKIAQLRAGNTQGCDRASIDIPHEHVIKDGDVLFSWSGSLLVSIWTGGPGALNQHLFKVTSPKFPRWFYFFWCREHLPEFQRIAQAKATTMGHIQRHHLTEALIAVPPDELLAKCDILIAPLIEKMVQNSLQSRTLASLRDTLLPKLLSGELRVRDAESAIATEI